MYLQPTYASGVMMIILGSGQKLLARLLDEHPFVTVKQPSNYIRHVSLFSEAWFEEESLETNRLNEGGISKEVLLDTLQVCGTLLRRPL